MKKVLFSISAIALLLTVFAPTASMGQGFNQKEGSKTRQVIAEGFGFFAPNPTIGWGLTAVSGRNHFESSANYRGFMYGTTPVHGLTVGMGYSLSGENAYLGAGIEAGLNGVARRWMAENRVFEYTQTSFMFKPVLGVYLRGGLTIGPLVLNAKVGYGYTFGMKAIPQLEGLTLVGEQEWTTPSLTCALGIGFGSRKACRIDGDHRMQVWGGYGFGLGQSQSAYTVGVDWFKRLSDHWIGFYGLQANQSIADIPLKSIYVSTKMQRVFFDNHHEGSWWNIEGGVKVGVAESTKKYELEATCGESTFGAICTKTTQAPSVGCFLGVNVAPLEALNLEWPYGHVEIAAGLDYSYVFPRSLSVEHDGNTVVTQKPLAEGPSHSLRASLVLRWTL